MKVLERNIWERIRSGDLRSFELLFESYFRGLVNYAQDLLKSNHDAEEIVQDVFFALWEKRDTITIHTSLKAYLFRSVHNHCMNFIQHRQVTHKKTSEFVVSQVEQTGLPFMAADEAALDRMMASELETEIEEAVKSLPHQCREVFYLSRYENLKIREVAERLGVSESTVKTQLARAMEKLRDLLKHHLN